MVNLFYHQALKEVRSYQQLILFHAVRITLFFGVVFVFKQLLSPKQAGELMTNVQDFSKGYQSHFVEYDC